jgi:predicted AAA+ superfamily ATPase
LLGYASIDLLRQSSESLAGRINYLEMGGFNLLEIPNNRKEIQKLWLRGGFPESYLSIRDDLSMTWLENLIHTYLERDIPKMGFRIPATRLRRLWTMLAHLQGEPVNYSKLGGNLEILEKAGRGLLLKTFI